MEIYASVNKDDVLEKLVAGQTLDSIRILHRQMCDGKEQLTRTIQQNVHRNYTEFVRISQEIQQLDKDMSLIKDFLLELRPASDLDKEIPLESQSGMTEQIEGLSSFLESGSHRFIYEYSGFSESTDMTTFKPCHLALFHDSLVVASLKKKVYQKPKLVVDRILNLEDISILDMKDTGIEFRFKLTAGQTSFIYRTEFIETKRNFVQMFKKAAEEISLAKASLGARDAPSQTLLASFRDLTTDEPSGGTTSINPDIVWLKDMCNELDVFIAHREIDPAIAVIEKAHTVLQTYGATIPNVIAIHRNLETRINNVANLLTRMMDTASHRPQSMQKTIQYLIRLGFGTRARDIFLQKRSLLMRSKLRMLPFEGDTVTYVHDFTYLFFTLFKKSVALYCKYFSVSLGLAETSGFVTWLRAEISWYLGQFRILVFQPSSSFNTIRECLGSAMDGCSLLKDVGVDLSYVFESGMKQDVDFCIEWYFTSAKARLTKCLSEDENHELQKLPALKVRVLDSDRELQLKSFVGTSSVKELVLIFSQALFSDLRPLLTSGSLTYYTNVVAAIVSLVEFYTRHSMDVLHDTSTTTQQRFHILVNLTYLAKHFLPFIQGSLESGVEFQCKHIIDALDAPGLSPAWSSLLNNKSLQVGFRRPIPELSKFNVRLQSMVDVAHSVCFMKATHEVLSKSYSFDTTGVDESNHTSFVDYSNPAYPVDDNMLPSKSIQEAFAQLKLIGDTANGILQISVQAGVSSEDIKFLTESIVMTACVELFIRTLRDDSNWTRNRRWGYSGLHQFILDIHYFLKAADSFAKEQTVAIATDMSSWAMKAYFQQCDEMEKKRVLKSGDWYDKRVEGLKK